MKKNIFGLYDNEVYMMLKEYGVEKFRIKQIFEWIYKRNVRDFHQMINLPLSMRNILDENFTVELIRIVDQQTSHDACTTKFLLAYPDAVAVETVLMRHDYGNSVCISTQVGCNMGCTFCASTLHGMVRNLSAAEILAQVVYVNFLLKADNQRIDSIVIMGSGEPLNNYDQVIKFIKLCHEKDILNLSYRNITLSTSGIVPNMYKLAEEQLPITLSVSLHAANNCIRTQLMPINQKYDIEKVISAASNYANKTGRRVTYEYILIENLNDSLNDAKDLVNLLQGKLVSINIIPVNPVKERGWYRPSNNKIMEFVKFLSKNNITTTLRKEMGSDIQAACGQLRNKHLREKG